MLDSETKRHIDSARQILVGVVPNPITQVNQITNALIYKFMDDMDQLAIKGGGKHSFFKGDLERYSWTKLLDSRVGNQEKMNLYVEALIKFSESKNLPSLFRDIFKNAFLPYRDPEVLGLFLAEINNFDYSHSEKLGDAYEYLLSIMGSQGDAGQFRTPRHIIDFMVDVVNPTKKDKVLDPACGTGGFLISAYKHILEQHDGVDEKGKKNNEKPLSPDDKRKITKNFEGYDVDPTMVKISQVNMYLHRFKDPQIYNYNTLSSEERWKDRFDVILANPPFMSPRGGIKPHSKFSITSSRSEALFVDYIMGHLKPKGRAGIIVPEGIIFKSDKAYKQLRKNLIEDGLYAVVSLPSGVFNPYAGVKTSILFFDNEIVEKTKDILFIKILNDGYDLGAQRRPRPDLPNDLFDEGGAIDVLREQKISVITGKKNKLVKENSFFAWLVSKEKIAEDGDYNLSGDRYREDKDYSDTEWPMVELGDVCELQGGYAFDSKFLRNEKKYQNDSYVIKIGNLKNGKIDLEKSQFHQNAPILKKYNINKGDILIAMTGATVGKVAVSDFDNLLLNQRVGLLRPNGIDEKFLKHLLLDNSFYDYCQLQAGGGAQGNISPTQIKKYKIPLPPIEIQKKIVEEIDGYQKIIDGARQVFENYKPNIKIDSDWKIVGLGDILEIKRGASPRPIQKYITNEKDGVNWIKIGDTKGASKYIEKVKEKITIEGAKKSRLVKEGDFILSNSMSFGRPYIMKVNGYIHDGWLLLRTKNNLLNKDFLYYILSSDFMYEEFSRLATGGVVKNLKADLVREIKIPLPPIEIQKKIVEDIEREEKIVNSNKELVAIFEKKIKDKISEVWG